jgi:hypothetical protein
MVRGLVVGAVPLLVLGCNGLFGIDEASEIGGGDAALGGGGGAGGNGGNAGNAGSSSGGAPGGGGVPSGGGNGGVAGGGGSAGLTSGGGGGPTGGGGGPPCSTRQCAFDKIECCQSTNVTSAAAVGNSIDSEVCQAEPFTCAICREGGGACSFFCGGIAAEFAICLECIIENCSGMYLAVKGACGAACSEFDTCMAGCGS